MDGRTGDSRALKITRPATGSGCVSGQVYPSHNLVNLLLIQCNSIFLRSRRPTVYVRLISNNSSMHADTQFWKYRTSEDNARDPTLMSDVK